MDDGTDRGRPNARPDPAAPPPGAGGPAPWRTLPIYYALLLAILTVAGLYLLLQLRHVLILLFLSVLFAAAVEGPARALERLRIPRGAAVVLIYAVAAAALAALLWYVLPPLFSQVARLGEEIPRYAARYEGLRETYESLRERYPELAPFEEQASSAGERLASHAGRRLLDLPGSLFSLFLDVLSVFAISILLVTGRERITEFGLQLVRPDRRAATRRVVDVMWLRLGHYLGAKLLEMVVVAAAMYGALRLIGVPFPLVLAVLVGLGEAVPRIGPWLARLPLLAIAALEGWLTVGLAFGASLVVENAKGYLLVPLVEGRRLNMHPLLTFVALLAGASLLGFAGAFVAVPAAAVVQVFVEEVVVPWRRRQLGEEPAAPVEEPGAAPAGRTR